MKTLILSLLAFAFAGSLLAQGGDPNYKPRRINKAIELLEDGQPIYYTGTGATDAPAGYDEGKKLAQTWADVIMYEGEHAPIDLWKLRDFMRGLVDGGPTKSGHRFPAVIVTLPVLGYDADYVRANSWFIAQVLGTGVLGIHLCHARDPKGVETFVEASRYPFERPGIKQLPEGLRGAGSQTFPAKIWGISPNQYLHVADPWPLNPQGEILLGVKIEDKYALANADKTAAVPGIGFAEWGPTDQTMSQLGLSAYANTAMPAGRGAAGGGGGGEDGAPGPGRGAAAPLAPVLVQTRTKVMNALKANHVAFLNSCNVDNVIDMIKEGVMVCTGSAAVAQKGREFTKRKMPW